MRKETKIVLLYRAAQLCWFIGYVLALPADAVNRLGGRLKARSHFLQFGERI